MIYDEWKISTFSVIARMTTEKNENGLDLVHNKNINMLQVYFFIVFSLYL